MAQQTTFEAVHTIEPIYTGGPVNFSQDGQVIATCVGAEVLLTHLATGRTLAKIEGDGDTVTALSLVPSCSHLTVCARSLSMRIYSLDRVDSDSISATLLRTLKPHTSPVITSQVDDTGSLVATGAADGVVKVWDIKGGYTTHTLHGHSGIISALKFFNVDDSSNKSSELEHRKRKRRRPAVEENGSTPIDGGGIANFRLASGDDEGKIRIWHLQKRKCLAVLDSHVSVIRGLDFQQDSQLLLSGSRDRTVMLWSPSGWELTKTIPVLEEVESAGFVDVQKNLIFTGGQTGNLKLWRFDGSEATLAQNQRSEGQGIVSVMFNAASSLFLSVHANQNILLHSFQPSNDPMLEAIPPVKVVRRISGTHDEVIDMAYVGGQAGYLAIATNLEELKILSLKTSETSSILNSHVSEYLGSDVGILQGHQDIIICIDVDWSGHWLATGAKDNTARLWKIDPSSNSYTCYATFTGHAESLGAIALPKQEPPVNSPAKLHPLDYPPPFVISGSQDRTIKRWDISPPGLGKPEKPQRAMYTRKAHEKDINALDVNCTSSLFLSASQDRTVKIWSLEEGETIGILRGHKRGVWSAKFSPSGTQSITAGNEGQTGTPSANSRGYVLTGSGDKTVKIWSVSDFTCLKTFEGHTNSILKVLWMNLNLRAASSKHQDQDQDEDNNKQATTESTKSSRTLQVASAGSDGLVKIWDVNTGECACTLDNHTDRIWALALNPYSSMSDSNQNLHDSKYHNLVSGSSDSTITLWRDTTQETTIQATIASNARIEQDQALQNYIRSRSYKPAILLALKLNHPGRLISLFKEVMKTWPKEQDSLTGVQEVDDVLKTLNDLQLLKLLERIREWNSNARTANVAQVLLWTLFKLHPAARFTRIASKRNIPTEIPVSDETSQPDIPTSRRRQRADMKDILDALRVYTERHYKRMEDILEDSFLVEYTLREMDEVTGSFAPSAPQPTSKALLNGSNSSKAGVNGAVNGFHSESDESDKIMLD